MSATEETEFIKIEEALENSFIVDAFPCEAPEIQIALIYVAKNKQLIPFEVFYACALIRYESKLIAAKYWLEETDTEILSRKSYSERFSLDAFDYLAKKIVASLVGKSHYLRSLTLFLKRCKGIKKEKTNGYLNLYAHLDYPSVIKPNLSDNIGSLDKLLPSVPLEPPSIDEQAFKPVDKQPTSSANNFYLLSRLEINFFMPLFKNEAKKNFFRDDISSMDAEAFMRTCLTQEIHSTNTSSMETQDHPKTLVKFEDIIRRARADYHHSLLEGNRWQGDIGSCIAELKKEIEVYEKSVAPSYRYVGCGLAGNELCAEFRRFCLSKIQENLNDLYLEKNLCKKNDRVNYQSAIDTCYEMIAKVNELCGYFNKSIIQRKKTKIAKEEALALSSEGTTYFFPEKQGAPSFFTQTSQVCRNCIDITGLVVGALCFGAQY